MLRRQRPQQLDCTVSATKLVDDAYDMDDDVDYDFVYRPLSNLPTPPMSHKDSESVVHSPAAPSSCLDHEGNPIDSQLRGAAIHLVNLIPTSASLATASVSRVQTILADADLQIETVALAVCILDSLGVRFARSWRLSCPLTPAIGASAADMPSPVPVGGDAAPPTRSKRHTLPPNILLSAQDQQIQQQLHIDSVGPELIVLAALLIAAKFVDDEQDLPNRYYTSRWGRDVWSTAQLNATERCMGESLRWRILPLCEEDCIAQAMDDMRAAGRAANSMAGFGFTSASIPRSTALVTPPASEDGPIFSPTHTRSMTDLTGQVTGLLLGIDFSDTSAVPTPRPADHMTTYFN